MPKEKHEPLFQQIQNDSRVIPSSVSKKSKKKEKVEEEQVDEKTSRKILKMVKEQQQEMNAAEPLEKKREWKPQQRDEEEEDDIEEQVEYEEWNQGQDLLMDQNDDRLLEKFMNGKKKLNLSEMIMSKIDAANAGKRPLLLR